MGKDWDKVVVGVPTWKECLRVLKPGGFAFVMSAPRQDVLAHMMVNLSNAGFETGFTSIYWAYATGFPKAMNIGKVIDKKLGVERTEVIGSRSRNVKPYDDSNGWNENNTTGNYEYKAPASEQAKRMDGSYAGFQPKPAVEVIIVCMKPLSQKNYVEQALSNGKGVTWLNDCRIPYTSEADMPAVRAQGERTDDSVFNKETCGFNKPVTMAPSPEGRFPANLLVSDNILDTGKITKAVPHGGDGEPLDTQEMGWGFKRMACNISDSGDFSRYFDLDKWWANFIITPKASRSERNKGLEDFESKPMGLNAKNRVYADKCATCKLKFIGGEPRCHCPPELKITDKENGYQYKNNHPTVKPLKLMSYLITLGSREGDIILDPFMGSGTTCLSASLLGRKYIGIEREEEYCKIAEGRLSGLVQQSNTK